MSPDYALRPTFAGWVNANHEIVFNPAETMLARRITPCLDLTGGPSSERHTLALGDAVDSVEIAARYTYQGAEAESNRAGMCSGMTSRSPDRTAVMANRSGRCLLSRASAAGVLDFSLGGAARRSSQSMVASEVMSIDLICQ
jgi:hypothetical protein